MKTQEVRMNTTGRITISCLLGGFIGALIALQFQLFWWVGSLIGGFVGYISYNFGEIREASKKVCSGMTEVITLKKVMRNIGDLCITFLGFIMFSIGLGSIASSIIIGLFNVLNIVILMVCGVNLYPDAILHSYSYWVGVTIIMYIACISLLVTAKDKEDGEDGELGALLIFALTPTLVFVTVPAIGLIGGICIIGYILYLLAKISWSTTKLVYSDIRLLCGVNSAIGATIGYFAGNALVGGLIGSVLGVINYQLISVRLLKLIPRST